MQAAAPAAAEPAPPAAPNPTLVTEAPKVIPPKPPVDFDLGAADDAAEDKPEPEEDQFINTVVIPPNAALSSKESARNSTDAFIARVKEQLSTPEPMTENQKDPFSSTIPH
jgi:hypothetical protein